MAIGNKLFYLKLLLIFIFIVSVLVFFYTVKLRGEIEKNTLFNIDETAMHDQKAIRTCIDFFLKDLHGIGQRLARDNCKTLRDLEKRLNLESATTSFNRIFMLAEDGAIYTDKFLVYKPGENNLGGRFDFSNLFSYDDRKALVFRFDDNAEFAGIYRESMLYAIRLDNFSVSGVKMKAIIGFTAINFLQDHMIIDSFVQNGVPHGFSSVINAAGNYIVGGSRDFYLKNDANFFTQLANASYATLTKRDIQTRMKEHESFSFYMEDKNGEKLVYFVPFIDNEKRHPDWYFIMLVDNDYLGEKQAMFSLMSLSLLGMVILALIIVMLYGIFTHNRLRMARQDMRVRSDFLSNMSHEIRTPLNGIIGMNYLISKNMDIPGREKQIRAWLAKSRILADYLLSLLNNILDMSRIRAGKIDLANDRFSIAAMLHDIIYMHSSRADEHGIRLTLQKKLSHPFVYGDEIRTKQILTNIVGNALKFTKPGGSVAITVTQHQTGPDQVETTYACEDTGIGMTQAFLEKIFDPFSQENSAQPNTPFKGTGLGLAISRQLAEAMHGSISVQSVPGEGSEFVVKIPSIIAEEKKSENQPAQKTAASEKQGKVRILLVEDSALNAEFLIDLLTDEGFEVEHAVNGQRAVEIFRDSPPNSFQIILMDMQMPVLDGCEAARKIRALHRPDAGKVLIYACTANAFREDMRKAMESGMNDFLTMPIDIKAFLEKLKSFQIANIKTSGTSGDRKC